VMGRMDDDVGSSGGQSQRACSADATGRAGDNCHMAVQIF
jgi:hypothetical protein